MSVWQVVTPTPSNLPTAREGDVSFAGAADNCLDQHLGSERSPSEALYFSRRARDELQAAIHADSGKARRAHLRLAEAYECRAHLITDQLRWNADQRVW
jgi:hypothetical protein